MNDQMIDFDVFIGCLTIPNHGNISFAAVIQGVRNAIYALI
jgi:hypothetical protein